MDNNLIGPFQIATSGPFSSVVDTRTGRDCSPPTNRLHAIQQAERMNFLADREADRAAAIRAATRR